MVTKSSALTFALLIVGGVSAGQVALRLPWPNVDVRFASEVPFNAEQMKGKLPRGREVVMVFIGSPECSFSTHPETAQLVREAAVSLRERATLDDAALVSVGVSANWVPGEGWRFLEGILNFDEVVIGRNWLNSRVVELGWSHPSAVMGTPQIIVYRQDVVPPTDLGRASTAREEPTVRVTGVEAIRRWVEAGSPLEWGERPAGVVH